MSTFCFGEKINYAFKPLQNILGASVFIFLFTNLKINVIPQVFVSCMVSFLIKNTMIKILQFKVLFQNKKNSNWNTKNVNWGDWNFIMIKTFIVSDKFLICRVSKNRNKYRITCKWLLKNKLSIQFWYIINYLSFILILRHFIIFEIPFFNTKGLLRTVTLLFVLENNHNFRFHQLLHNHFFKNWLRSYWINKQQIRS